MRYIVIEDWENIPFAIVNDTDGNTFVTNSLQEAINEANMCQDGIVLPLDENIISLIDYLKFEYNEDIDKTNIKGKTNKILGKNE